ncbi:MAG: hypothetical protein ACK5HT_05980 [Draconibacterium sp.]
MISSQKENIAFALLSSNRSVFHLKDIALLTGISDFQTLNNKINYAVRTGKLLNPRKGIYTKPVYNKEEMACAVFVPGYISLEYVLQKAGVLFQFDSSITALSYLSRTIEIENQTYRFRKIKNNMLGCTDGIIKQNDTINIASPERAFLDLLYLEKNYYFDNLTSLNKRFVRQLLPLYQSNALNTRVNKLLYND